ncbi:MAG TPA: hypothetical protein VHG32_00305 [Thermoanaerobaculia bacterium]|nr:hypothetical protein [Thermoanaerobaculia bacterium]
MTERSVQGPHRQRTMARHAWYVRAAAAAWGFALAVVLGPRLQRPAAPDQIPGAMTALGLDAAGPFLQLAALILVPMACALAGALAARRLADAPAWARIACCAALAGAPLTLLYGGDLADVLLLGAVAAAAAAAGTAAAAAGKPAPDLGDQAGGRSALPVPAGETRPPRLAPAGRPSAKAALPRGLRPVFSRWDLLLIPASLVCYFAVLDLAPAGRNPVTCLLVAVILMLALRLGAGRIASLRHPGLALAPAPLAVMLQLQWLPAKAAAIAALAWIVAAPLAVAFFVRAPTAERRLRAVVALAVYPLFVLAYPVALLGIGSPLHLDFFEDGHELLPAGEMLRGRLPYADIVPTHGLISDGAIDLLVMKSGHASTGDVLAVRRVVRCLNFPAVYAVALAATGAADAGLLAALLSVTLFPGMGLRPALALFALAGAAAATRLRSPRWLAVAGAVAAVSFLASPDFAVYSGIVAAVAAVRSARRGRALAALAAGGAAAGAAILAAFATMGFAGAFLRVTFHELLPAGRAYVSGPLAGPDCLRALGTSLPSWVQPECVCALLWVLIVLATAAGLARAPFAAARGDGVWLIGLWIALAGAAYAERRHLYASIAMAAFLVGALYLLAHQRARAATVALAVALAWLANPLGHLFGLATPLRTSGGARPPAGAVEIDATPRCRGVVFDPALRAPIEAVKRFVDTQLRPGETWFDFTNHPVLYYLFARRCPMRHQEIPFVESAAAQREVITRLERDLSVRAVLIDFPDVHSAIDGVSNRVRAPLLRGYLGQRFVPAFADHGVVFWIRR